MCEDMLLLVNDCKTKYITKDKQILTTQSGDVVYVPKGSEYEVECIESAQKSSTLQINFSLLDEDFKPFILSDSICIFSSHNPNIRSLFEKMMLFGTDTSCSIAQNKSVLYEIFATLFNTSQDRDAYKIIQKGFDYLIAHYDENPSIPLLASMCNVSNEYFRKLFKKQTGHSPAEYKNELRIKKAEQYLLYSNMSISEISERLSFATVSHFIKCFKDIRACSPLEFRKKYTQIN